MFDRDWVHPICLNLPRSPTCTQWQSYLVASFQDFNKSWTDLSTHHPSSTCLKNPSLSPTFPLPDPFTLITLIRDGNNEVQDSPWPAPGLASCAKETIEEAFKRWGRCREDQQFCAQKYPDGILAAFLVRVIRPFASPRCIEQLGKLEKLSERSKPDLSASNLNIRIMEELRADQVHKQAEQRLRSLPDGTIFFRDLVPEGTPTDLASYECPIDSKKGKRKRDNIDQSDMRESPSDRRERDAILKIQDPTAKKDRSNMLLSRGVNKGALRPKFWRVALDTNSRGERYLTDEQLDKYLPLWRKILLGKKNPPKTSEDERKAAGIFGRWKDRERLKATQLNRFWPDVGESPSSPQIQEDLEEPEGLGGLETPKVFERLEEPEGLEEPEELEEPEGLKVLEELKQLVEDLEGLEKLEKLAKLAKLEEPENAFPSKPRSFDRLTAGSNTNK
jgi:hypothetical protein